MSKSNNVNPDHYKLAGRERPGKADPLRNQAQSSATEERQRWSERKKLEVRGKKKEVSDAGSPEKARRGAEKKPKA
jgi:hypothetical protein